MPHWHEHIELHYILEGKTRIKLNQNEFIVQKGNLVIFNSNELHSGYCEPFRKNVPQTVRLYTDGSIRMEKEIEIAELYVITAEEAYLSSAIFYKVFSYIYCK